MRLFGPSNQGIWIWAVVIAILVVGASPSSAAAGLINAYGTWRDAGGRRTGVWQAELETADANVAGTIRIIGWHGLEHCSLSGSLSHGRIQFGLIHVGPGQARATFEGTIEGEKIGGSFSAFRGVAGTWTGRWNAK